MPDAAGEHHVLLLVVVPQLRLHAKEETLLHAQAHVVDSRLLLVVHGPGHLLVGKALKGALLDLHLEDLAELLCLVGHSLKLWRHHVELGGGATHANEHGTAGDGRHAALDVTNFLAVDGLHTQPVVVVARHHIEHQLLVAHGGAVGLVALHTLHEDGVGDVKHLVLFGDDCRPHVFVGSASRGGLGVALSHGGEGGLGVYVVVVYNHAPRVLRTRAARELVDRGRHGADLHNLLVDLVEQQLGRCLAAAVGGEGFVHHMVAACHASYHDGE